MVAKRVEEVAEHEEREAARRQEHSIEEAEVKKLPNQAGRGSSASFSSRDGCGWVASRLRAQPRGGDPIYVLDVRSVRLPLSILGAVVKILGDAPHAGHGKGSKRGGPDDPDCPCRTTDDREACALMGCGFCYAARKEK